MHLGICIWTSVSSCLRRLSSLRLCSASQNLRTCARSTCKLLPIQKSESKSFVHSHSNSNSSFSCLRSVIPALRAVRNIQKDVNTHTSKFTHTVSCTFALVPPPPFKSSWRHLSSYSYSSFIRHSLSSCSSLISLLCRPNPRAAILNPQSTSRRSRIWILRIAIWSWILTH